MRAHDDARFFRPTPRQPPTSTLDAATAAGTRFSQRFFFFFERVFAAAHNVAIDVADDLYLFFTYLYGQR